MDLLIFDEHQATRSKAKLLGWCAARIRDMRQEIKQVESVIDDMQYAGLVGRHAQQLHKRATRRLGYYETIQAAVLKGYLIAPALPLDAFIIRSQAHPVAESDADPAWPFPTADAMQQKTEAASINLDGIEFDDVRFPISMCKPQIIPKKATEIQRMLFDRIGVQSVPVRGR